MKTTCRLKRLRIQIRPIPRERWKVLMGAMYPLDWRGLATITNGFTLDIETALGRRGVLPAPWGDR